MTSVASKGHHHHNGVPCGSSHGVADSNVPATPEGPIVKDIFYAALNGDLEGVKQFVEQEGVSVDQVDEDATTALHWAAYRRQNKVMRYLIQKGCHLEPANASEGQTPLHWASISGNIPGVIMLLEAGASLTKTDSRGYNALHHAAQYNEILVSHLLLTRGIPLDGLDNEGHSALHWAAYQGHENLVRYLLKRGAAINLQDASGCTPLHWAAIKSNISVIELLLLQGANLRLKDKDGAVAEQLAVSKKNFAAARVLRKELMNPISVNEKNLEKYQWTWFFLGGMGIIYMFFLFANMWFPFALVSWLLTLLFGKTFLSHTFPGKDSPNPVLVAVFAESYLISTVLYFTKIVYVTGETLWVTILFILINVFYACLHLYMIVSDPGVVHSGVDISQLIETIDDNMPNPQVCPTCWIQKPIRSKHCRTCGVCVARFDHHCNWIYNCVGAGNHMPFIFLLTSVITLHAMFSWFCFSYLIEMHGGFGFWSFIPMLGTYLREDALVFLLAVFHLGNFGWEVFVWITQVQGICYSLTFNELANRTRYMYLRDFTGKPYNPFDKGTLGNIKEFFLGSDVDWTQVYTWPPTPPSGKVMVRVAP